MFETVIANAYEKTASYICRMEGPEKATSLSLYSLATVTLTPTCTLLKATTRTG